MIAQDLITAIKANLDALAAAFAALADQLKAQDPTPALQEIDTQIQNLTAAVQALVAPK